MAKDPTEPTLVPAFDASRLAALENYGMVERWLGAILAGALGVNLDVAWIILYRLTNTRSRYAIISDLISRSKHSQVRPFWASIEKRLGKLDSRRNQIVHWVTQARFDESKPVDMTMVPGHRSSDFTDALSIADLDAFSAECKKLIHPMGMFAGYLAGSFGAPERAALLEIFREPLNDHTPAALQRALNPKA